MRVYFNLGLALPSGGMLDADDTASKLAADGFTVHRIVESATEPTVVISYLYPDGLEWIGKYAAGILSKVWSQDAVAWYLPDAAVGGLEGPKAAEWGPFNLDYFIMPS